MSANMIIVTKLLDVICVDITNQAKIAANLWTKRMGSQTRREYFEFELKGCPLRVRLYPIATNEIGGCLLGFQDAKTEFGNGASWVVAHGETAYVDVGECVKTHTRARHLITYHDRSSGIYSNTDDRVGFVNWLNEAEQNTEGNRSSRVLKGWDSNAVDYLVMNLSDDLTPKWKECWKAWNDKFPL